MSEKVLSYEEYQKNVVHNEKLRKNMIDELSKSDDFKRIAKYLPKLNMESYETYIENSKNPENTPENLESLENLEEIQNEEIGACESKN